MTNKNTLWNAVSVPLLQFVL